MRQQIIKKMILKVLVTVFLFPTAITTFADNVEDAAPRGGVVRGYVADSQTGQPVEYATVAIYQHQQPTPITGGVTDLNGRFRITGLNEGDFDVEITFMGYESKRFNKITLKKEKMMVDMGQVKLKPATENIKQVDVVATRNAVEYKIDKKVVPVSKQLTAASMSAVEVLENVPSVKVDLEGNVSLRGSSSFTVLIDGRPTVLDPSDALKQIPASSIENIEIITNPSVKYAPDGTSGIINIILKRNRMQGVQGQVSANAGLDNKYGIDALLTMRKNKFAFTLGGNIDNKEFPGFSYSDRTTQKDNSTYNVVSDGERTFKRRSGSIRLGVDYDLTDKDVLSISTRLGRNNMGNNSDMKFTEVVDNGTPNISWSNQENDREMNFISVNGSWQHKFNNKGHNIITMLDVAQRKMDGTNTTAQRNSIKDIIESTKNFDDVKDNRSEVKVDYTLPLGGESRFETGFQGRFNTKKTGTELILNGMPSPEFSNRADFSQDVYSIYTSYSGKAGNLGYQAGFRTEMLDRNITVVETNKEYALNRWDFFPTLHLSYQLPKEHQLMASYTRRTSRMWDWILLPFTQYVDAYNIRMGDPTLQPSLIDSWEAGYIKQFNKSQLSAELYHRVTHDKTEFLMSAYDGKVAVMMPKNIGKDYSTGIELNFSTKVAKIWEPTIMGSIYHYKVDSYRNGKKGTRESNNWDLRLNNNLQLHKNVVLQINGNYSSPTVNSQGSTKGFYSFDSALRTEFLQRKLSAVIQIRDIFQTGIRKSTTDTETLKAYSKDWHKAPMASITLTYKINDFKPKRSSKGGNGSEMEDMGGEGF